MDKRRKDVGLVVAEVLFDMRISRRYRGYRYVYHSLLILLEDESQLNYITKGVYMPLGYKFEVDPNVVERDIRSIKELSWEFHKDEALFKGYKKVPNNGVFLDILLYEVQKRLREYEEDEIA